MARYRSRRTSRRSAAQSAASLLALALPAPMQRVADTRLGPLLMLVGVPAMIVAGVLQFNSHNGIPSLTVDPQAAGKVVQSTRDGYNNFGQHLEQQGGLGHLASDLLNGISHSSHAPTSYGQSYPTPQNTPASATSRNFPSTQPTSTLQRDNRYTSTQPTNTYAQPQSYAQPQTYNQTYAQQHQPTYSQQTYSQQTQQNYAQQPQYNTQSTYAQQPNYSGYNQYAASPSDTRNLTSQQQQQTYQNSQYASQQQLYDQRLREQQHQQWIAQQMAASTRQQGQTGYQQLDAYGRPVSTSAIPNNSAPTGYAQPSYNYAQPTNQYGQQNYNQGFVPNANTNGRY